MSDESFKLVMPVSDRDVFNWVFKTSSDTSFRAAYWIAFGPHGPRAQTPPGEGKQVFWYTMGGLGVTAVLFFGIRAGARGSPPTMTKEYQEASDAYLKVRPLLPVLTCLDAVADNRNYRRTTSSPSLVSLPRTTRVASWSRASLPRSKRLFNRKVLYYCIHEGANRVCHRRRRSIIPTGRREGYTSFWSPLIRSNDEKRSLVPLFYYSSVLVQRSYFICFTSLTLPCSFLIISCPLGVCSVKALLPNLENHW